MRSGKYRRQWFLVSLFLVTLVYILLKTIGYQRPEQELHTERSLLERDYVLQQETNAALQKVRHTVRSPRDTAVRPLIYRNTGHLPAGARKAVLKTLLGKTPMFVYPPEIDNMISSRIRDYGTWEEDLLNATGRLFLNSRQWVFLDIGCNIGAYTLFIAKLGVPVVAVDPVAQNLQLLSKSLQIGNLTKHVTLINNAISNSRRNTSVVIPNGNVGGAYISDGENEAHSQSVTSILLDDLTPLLQGQTVFLKIDIEGHEYNALSSGQNFFQSVDVRCILMEWVHHRHTDNGPRISRILISYGFLPYEDAGKERILHPDRGYRWPENVFWFKR